VAFAREDVVDIQHLQTAVRLHNYGRSRRWSRRSTD
jgi:hypothetical protein